MKQIVTRADDAGMAKIANLAIKETCEEGLVRNISILACSEEIEHAAETLKDLPRVAFGLHACFTCEWGCRKWHSVLPGKGAVSLMMDNGVFPPNGNYFNDHKPNPDEAYAELKAQLTILQNLGFNITYMDEHMGIGNFGDMEETFKRFAADEGLIFRPETERLSLAGDDKFELVKNLEDGDYLWIGHPVYPDEELKDFRSFNFPDSDISESRNKQRLMFLDPDLIKVMQENNVCPVRYTDL